MIDKFWCVFMPHNTFYSPNVISFTKSALSGTKPSMLKYTEIDIFGLHELIGLQTVYCQYHFKSLSVWHGLK